MTSWNYGDAYLRHPVPLDEPVIFADGSIVKVHDIFNPLPDFMLSADLLFIDPPWNLGNLKSFYTKANCTACLDDFTPFYLRLFDCIKQIAPKTCYIEIGKDYLAEIIIQMKNLFRQVTFYNSTYYHKQDNICYIVRGSSKRKKLSLDYMDEENIIEWVCTNEDYDCIGDLCIGTGLVGINAYKNNKRFVGTELNYKRLAVLCERMLNHVNKQFKSGLKTEVSGK